MKNALALIRPDLIKEWDYEANESIDPNDISTGVHKKVWWKCKNGHKWQAMVYSRVSGHGCPFCANQLPIIGENDFATLHPGLLLEWDYEANRDIDPRKLTDGSGKNVSWICKYGHKWKASIVNRSKKGSGCPYCSRKLPIIGENDLLTLRPDLAKEWDYTSNGNTKPESVFPQSGKSVSWVCSKCGYTWKAVISNRSAGYNNCPHCDSLAMKYPEVAKEWDYELNAKIKETPDNIPCGSSKKVWWLCSRCGNRWETTVANRTRGTGCPNCNSHTSFPEQAIFYYIKKYYPDAVNRYKLEKYEIDIFIPSIKVGIEYDGVFFHQKKAEMENEKDNACYGRLFLAYSYFS